jgi:hypothetical protein
MAKMMMPKRDKRLLEKIEFSKRRKSSEAEKLERKRRALSAK